jgi:hypothetical protein
MFLRHSKICVLVVLVFNLVINRLSYALFSFLTKNAFCLSVYKPKMVKKYDNAETLQLECTCRTRWGRMYKKEEVRKGKNVTS